MDKTICLIVGLMMVAALFTAHHNFWGKLDYGRPSVFPDDFVNMNGGE